MGNSPDIRAASSSALAKTHVHFGRVNAYDERLNLRLGVFGKDVQALTVSGV